MGDDSYMENLKFKYPGMNSEYELKWRVNGF